MVAAVHLMIEAEHMHLDLTPEERFELFGDFDVDSHAVEARERWGETEAYKEARRRTAGYRAADWRAIKSEAGDIEADLATVLSAGEPADGERAMDLAERHRAHISRWFYQSPPRPTGASASSTSPTGVLRRISRRSPQAWPSSSATPSWPTRTGWRSRDREVPLLPKAAQRAAAAAEAPRSWPRRFIRRPSSHGLGPHDQRASTPGSTGRCDCARFPLEDPELERGIRAAAALAQENERLDAELRAHVKELRASRARMVEAGLAERRRLERDLHDGAQQRLVSLVLGLRMIEKRLDKDPASARGLLEMVGSELEAALRELRDLTRGIHPAVLSERGLDVALETLAGRAPLPVELEATIAERLPEPIELTLYFVVSEALTNIAKHAHASQVNCAPRTTMGTSSSTSPTMASAAPIPRRDPD